MRRKQTGFVIMFAAKFTRHFAGPNNTSNPIKLFLAIDSNDFWIRARPWKAGNMLWQCSQHVKQCLGRVIENLICIPLRFSKQQISSVLGQEKDKHSPWESWFSFRGMCRATEQNIRSESVHVVGLTMWKEKVENKGKFQYWSYQLLCLYRFLFWLECDKSKTIEGRWIEFKCVNSV